MSMAGNTRFCDGLARRDFLRVGTAGLFGLTLPAILERQAPGAGFNPNLNPNNQRPAHGSIIAKKLGPRGGVPPYVCLPKMHPSGGPAYLGAGAAPFVIDADPNAPNFAVPDLLPPVSLAAGRLQSR